MCEISNGIKLCSCAELNIEDDIEINYWVLSKQGETSEFIVGEAFYSFGTLHSSYESNKMIILDVLNGGKAFDFSPKLEEGDILELFFIEENMDQTYSYIYENETWIYHGSDYFFTQCQIVPKEKGKIKC